MRLDFDRRLELESRGAVITSDAGLLACQELDDVLGLTAMVEETLADGRCGRNTLHSFRALFRQAVFSRLADYEGTNDAERLGQLIDLIGTLTVGNEAIRSKDIPGQVYECFFGKFAVADGKLGGESFTSRCVARLLAKMIEPFKEWVYDFCCGSGGML